MINTFINDRSSFSTVRQQNPMTKYNYLDFKTNLNFNIFEKLYFFCRRKLDSRKKSIINY